MPIGVGLAILIGHSEIELFSGRIRSLERAGPFRWSRARRAMACAISSSPLNCDPWSSSFRPCRPLPPFLADLAGLRAEFNSGKPMFLALGYPVTSCGRSPICWANTPTASVSACPLCPPTRPATVQVLEEDLSGNLQAIDAPIDNPRQHRRGSIAAADGLTITCRPPACFKGSKGLVGFAVLWPGSAPSLRL